MDEKQASLARTQHNTPKTDKEEDKQDFSESSWFLNAKTYNERQFPTFPDMTFESGPVD